MPVGYSESIFQPLGESLGSEAADAVQLREGDRRGDRGERRRTARRSTVRRSDHLIKVWVFNSQNVTPEVQQVNAIARAAHIPIATITETLSPATLNFEQWQVAELERLLAALHQATGR